MAGALAAIVRHMDVPQESLLEGLAAAAANPSA
jgi:hypothetical protein